MNVLSAWPVSRAARWAYYRWGNLRALLHGTKVGAGAAISPRAEVRDVAFVGAVSIGSGVRIGPGTYLGSGSVDSGSIGAFCSIGYGIHIGPSEHDVSCWTTSPFLLRALGEADSAAARVVAPPLIGSDVWIGAGAVVLRGAVIGDGAVIGAGSVVRGRVPSYEIWAGVPARRIRSRFASERQTGDARGRLATALARLGIDQSKWWVSDDMIDARVAK